MGRLDGKIAIITGAARGQGAAEARRFVAEGARVMVTDVLDDEGQTLVDELGAAARWFHLEVSDEDSWNGLVAHCEDELGAPTVLVNNAGVLSFNPITEVEPAEFRRVLEINLVGTFLGIRAVAPLMERAGGGSIVNIASTGGITGMPAVAPYVASKFGVTGMTKTAAMDLGPAGIRVNSVHPGAVATPMIMFEGVSDDDYAPYYERLPVKRIGTPDDVAAMVVFLASDESAYCTGAEFVVDGGQTCGDHGALG